MILKLRRKSFLWTPIGKIGHRKGMAEGNGVIRFHYELCKYLWIIGWYMKYHKWVHLSELVSIPIVVEHESLFPGLSVQV